MTKEITIDFKKHVVSISENDIVSEFPVEYGNDVLTTLLEKTSFTGLKLVINDQKKEKTVKR